MWHPISPPSQAILDQNCSVGPTSTLKASLLHLQITFTYKYRQKSGIAALNMFICLLSLSHAKVWLKNTLQITTPCVGYAVSVRLLKIIIQYHAESCVQIGQRIRQSFLLPLTICHCQCRLLFSDRWSILQPRRQRCTYECICAENICATQTLYTLALHIRPVRQWIRTASFMSIWKHRLILLRLQRTLKNNGGVWRGHINRWVIRLLQCPRHTHTLYTSHPAHTNTIHS